MNYLGFISSGNSIQYLDYLLLKRQSNEITSGAVDVSEVSTIFE
jgi:hypothetical protein